MKFLLVMGVLPGLMAAGVDAAEPDRAIRFFEERVSKDPDDIVAQNQLADRCLAKLRESGRIEWLRKARTAVDASLHSVPEKFNAAGLLASARVALAEHRFADAAKQAAVFCEGHPNQPGGYETLFDAQLEMGAYDEAARTLDLLAGKNGDSTSVHIRRAQWAGIHGEDARLHWERALAAARERQQPELLGWCLCQRGGLAFASGDFSTAEKQYSEALALAPGDWRARSQVAELRAAEGRHEEALGLLTKVIEATERPELMQAAGDIEAARGRGEAARVWHDRALAAYRASLDRGEKLHLHHLAGFYCDVRPLAAEAVRLAREDLAGRGSIHAHAMLAWALHLDGKLEEAAAEAALALRTGAKDAHLLHQAGLIFTAAGDLTRGRAAIRAAVEANPRGTTFHFHR
jgi:tetratricopeptide (TPR) repeat protein